MSTHATHICDEDATDTTRGAQTRETIWASALTIHQVCHLLIWVILESLFSTHYIAPSTVCSSSRLPVHCKSLQVTWHDAHVARSPLVHPLLRCHVNSCLCVWRCVLSGLVLKLCSLLGPRMACVLVCPAYYEAHQFLSDA